MAAAAHLILEIGVEIVNQLEHFIRRHGLMQSLYDEVLQGADGRDLEALVLGNVPARLSMLRWEYRVGRRSRFDLISLVVSVELILDRGNRKASGFDLHHDGEERQWHSVSLTRD